MSLSLFSTFAVGLAIVALLLTVVIPFIAGFLDFDPTEIP